MKTLDDCFHLSVDNVLKIHEESIRHFGGASEIRSRELLESAISAAQAEFGGKSVFSDLIEVAAAYLFYLCSNHPFVDGNKRTALGACIVFLKLNGVSLPPDSEDWESLTFDVAAGRINRGRTTERLRALIETA